VPSGGFVSFRAQRLEVTLWGQPLAVLAYSGPLASGQSEFNDGRYSLITIPRNPSEEIIFLRSEVWPVIGSSSLTTGGFKNLAPETVLPPDEPRLDRLERNLLRAAWYPVAFDLGLTADAMPRTQAWRQAAFRRLQERVITGEERNGFLHESQHALDEAHKVYPELYRDPTRGDRAAAELRASLAALAHSGDPHYELYQQVRQYRRRQEPYAAAVAEMLSLMAESILTGSDHYGGLKPDKNVMLQLPRISAKDLRRLAAHVMAHRFSKIDRQAGYHLDYDAYELSARELQVGTLRGEIRPEDLPPPAGETLAREPLAWWDITGRQVEAAGFHIYLAGQGVQVAQADEYGLAIGPGGYLAAHARVKPGQGPWRLEITGGLFQAGETAGERTGLEVFAGLERVGDLARGPGARRRRGAPGLPQGDSPLRLQLRAGEQRHESMRSQRVGSSRLPVHDAGHGCHMQSRFQDGRQCVPDGATRGDHILHHEDRGACRDVVLDPPPRPVVLDLGPHQEGRQGLASLMRAEGHAGGDGVGTHRGSAHGVDAHPLSAQLLHLVEHQVGDQGQALRIQRRPLAVEVDVGGPARRQAEGPGDEAALLQKGLQARPVRGHSLASPLGAVLCRHHPPGKSSRSGGGWYHRETGFWAA